MKVKENDVFNCMKGLEKIMNKDMPGKVAVAIINNRKALDSSFEALNDVIRKAAQKYAEKDDNGNPTTENGRYVITKENQAKFDEELEEIGQQEVEISELTKIDISLFEEVNGISAADIYRLSIMIK